jgi:lipid-A-disaccharide synthase-like uncharacterized protein
MSLSTFWLVLGFSGQGLFASRFLVQWISSERKRRSHIPVAFWYLSILGGLITLAYAIHLGDPPFILGQSMGVFVYSRNLVLLKRGRVVMVPSGGN